MSGRYHRSTTSKNVANDELKKEESRSTVVDAVEGETKYHIAQREGIIFMRSICNHGRLIYLIDFESTWYRYTVSVYSTKLSMGFIVRPQRSLSKTLGIA